MRGPAAHHSRGVAVRAAWAGALREDCWLHSGALGCLLHSPPPFCQEVTIFRNKKSTFRGNMSNPRKIPHEELCPR